MRLQIDTVSKTIKVESAVKFKDLIVQLDKLFPKKEWKEYKLETNTVINNWSYPVYIDRHYKWYEWNGATCFNNIFDPIANLSDTAYQTKDYSVNTSGIYNLEIK